MRARSIVLAFGFAIFGSLGSLQGAGAASTSSASSVKTSEIGVCVKEAVASGTDPETCVQAQSPMLPATNELVFGSAAFLILVALMYKFAYPSAVKTMNDRTNKIRDSLDEAERSRAEAASNRDELNRQLADAKNEANRIIDEARITAEQVRKDLIAKAEADASALRLRGQADIEAAKKKAVSDAADWIAQSAANMAAESLLATPAGTLVDLHVKTLQGNRS